MLWYCIIFKTIGSQGKIQVIQLILNKKNWLSHSISVAGVGYTYNVFQVRRVIKEVTEMGVLVNLSSMIQRGIQKNDSERRPIFLKTL